jgi:hypothetical protein
MDREAQDLRDRLSDRRDKLIWFVLFIWVS